MWKEIMKLFKKDSLCEEAFEEAIEMLRVSRGMFNDAIASLREEGGLDVDIYARDRQINKYERDVRRKIVTHLAISSNPDANMGLVLTAIVIDIERVGDYTKNIVELAATCNYAFKGGEIEGEIGEIENTVVSMFDDIIFALEKSDTEKARKIYAEHEALAHLVEESIQRLIRGEMLTGDSGNAVTAALYLRYLKRISAHLKNVATSIVNPYYRIGFREKPGNSDDESPDEGEEE